MTNRSLASIIQVRLALRGTAIGDEDALDIAQLVADSIDLDEPWDAEPTKEISPTLLDNLRAACAVGV